MGCVFKIDKKTGQRILLSLLSLSAITTAYAPPAEAEESAVASTTSDSEKKEAVVDWFKKYDQIRRDAELNLMEKFQTMSFLDKNVEHTAVLRRRDKDLVERMSSKYAKADEAMRNLPSMTATRELQDGYIDYFSQVHKIFTQYLKSPAAGEPPCSPSTMRERRSALEELDFKNKKLDTELRQEFGIAKHKHS
jgi:hypothetical protein